MKSIRSVLMVLALLFAWTACTPEENGGKEGNKENKENETPQPVLVTGITLDGASVSLLVGEGATVKATVSPDNANNKAVSWSSSDESVAKVDGNGVVKAIAKGKADIVASSSDGSAITAKCEVVVSNPCPEGAVDLGLTTSEGFRIYWASSNLSTKGLCEHPEDYGDYFAWGMTETYYTSTHPFVWKSGKSDGYSWSTYKWYKGTDKNQLHLLSKYCQAAFADQWAGEGKPDGKRFLDPEDDAAHVILGANWRIPTIEDFTNLRNSCAREWTTENDVRVMKMTASNGNSIVIPACGSIINTYFAPSTNHDGSYWTSEIPEGKHGYAGHAFADVNDLSRGFASRSIGMCIRPVSD